MEKERLLGTGARKVLKGFHVTFVAFAGGGLLSVIVIVLLKRLTNLDESIALLDLGVYKIFNAVNYSFFALITTSVIYALFTQWGFFRHYWITVKWIVLAGIFAITWFLLGPSINGMASLSDAGFHTSVYRTEYLRFVNRSLLFTLMELACVIFILFISTIKPWGALQHAPRLKRKALLSVVIGLVVIVIGMSVPASLSQRKYRRMPIANSDLAIIPDGTHNGEAEVGGFVYKVEVEVLERRIRNVRAVRNRNSPYALYAEGVFRKIVRDQNANTDSVTGATTTSKALMKAVENALQNAEMH